MTSASHHIRYFPKRFWSRRLNLIICFGLCSLFFFGSILSLPKGAALPTQVLIEPFDYRGPYINKVVFGVYHGEDAQWAALSEGLIDVGNAFLTPQERADVELDEWETNAFWGLACATHFDPFFIEEPYGPPGYNGFPLNYVELRQAIAMALDKQELARLAFGDAGVALDHVIPSSFVPWHEPDLGVDYRQGDLQGAIQLLENAGFIDFNLDGIRDAPDATETTISLYYVPFELLTKDIQHSVMATNTTLIAEFVGNTLGALDFAYELHNITSSTMWAYTHIGYRSYQLALLPFYVPSRAPYLLEELFYSMNIPTSNIMNFDNTTVDTLIETMNSTYDYDAFNQVVSDLQKVIAENQPLIPLCTTNQYTGHRTNRFYKWFDQPQTGSANPWSLVQAQLLSGQPDRNPITGVGGRLDFGLNKIPLTLNPILATLDDSWLVLESIYSRLIEMNPLTGEALPSLARSWIIEPEGDGLKITFNLVNNATWHDGEIFSADDVVFTYNYLNNLPGPWPLTRPRPHIEFTSIDELSNVTFTFHTTLNDYFALFDITWPVILPQHIWEGILQPAFFDNPRPMGTGPFVFDKRPEPGIIYLKYNPDYHYGISGLRELPPVLDVSFLVWLSGGVFVIVLTVIGAIWYLRRTPHGFGN